MTKYLHINFGDTDWQIKTQLQTFKKLSNDKFCINFKIHLYQII